MIGLREEKQEFWRVSKPVKALGEPVTFLTKVPPGVSLKTAILRHFKAEGMFCFFFGS